MTPGIRLLLVDGLNLVRRVYAAQPGADGPEKAEAGREASGQSLRRALRECEPSHAVAIFEGREETWRHEVHPGYKEGHKPMPEALREALPGYREDFAELGVSSFELPKTEADDVIGTLAVKVAAAGGEALILSTDRIYLQLLNDRIRVRDHFAQAELDRETVGERFGVPPERLPDLLALTGDSSQGIPGVPGIGPKTAPPLLAPHASLEDLLTTAQTPTDQLPSHLSPTLAEKLTTHADDARLSLTLTTLRTDLDLGLNLQTMRYRP